MERAPIDTCSPEAHIESQATNQATHHGDVGKSVDLARQQVDKVRMCRRANMAHKDHCLALQKLSDLGTGMEVVETSVDLGRNNVARCYNAAVASDSKPNP